jgi:3-mercaptopyruvate sulfurtransferase SseA
LLIIATGVVLLLVAAFVLIRQNQQVQAPLSTASPDFPAAVAEETYPEIPRVTLLDAKTAFDQDSAVFIDVRAAAAYESGHVKGSLNIPLADLPNYLNELKKGDWIIPYCT